MLSSTQAVAAQDFAASNVTKQSVTQETLDGIASDCNVLHAQVDGIMGKLESVLRAPAKDAAEAASLPPAATTLHANLLGTRHVLASLMAKLRSIHDRLEL